jgi:hypothetical protein
MEVVDRGEEGRRRRETRIIRLMRQGMAKSIRRGVEGTVIRLCVKWWMRVDVEKGWGGGGGGGEKN